MAQEIEIEFKNLLTKEEYDVLLNNLPFPKTAQKQVNYYFETNDFQLANKQSALRIREKNGKYMLTLKEPHTEGLLETHDILTKDEAESWLRGNIIPKAHTTKQLEAMGIAVEDLIYYGELMTLRRETTYKDVLIVLDYSTYNDHEDYEFELEADAVETGKKQFEAILSQFDIPKRKTLNKIERFFHSKK